MSLVPRGPMEIGVSGTREIKKDDSSGPELSSFNPSATLTDITKTHTLFTYAPLFTYGGLQHNPVQEWINLDNKPEIVRIIKLPLPIFELNSKPFLNNMIWAVRNDYWKELAFHISSIAILDRTKKIFVRPMIQELEAPDVVMAYNCKSDIPKVKVFTFSVDSNRFCLPFLPISLTSRVLKVKFFPPRAETVKLGAAMLGEIDSPYEEIQPYPWEINNENKSKVSTVQPG